MIHAHAAALWGLAETQVTAQVFRGAVPPTTAPPYVVMYVADVDPELGPSRDLVGNVGSYTAWAYVHSVGATEESAIRVADAVRTVMLNVRPTILSRQCQKVRREFGRPVERDQSTSSTRWTKVDVYRLDSEPA